MTERILCVDDVADILALLSACLEEEGYEVLCAEGGEQALELAVSARPDAILLDVMMPGIDGIEVCRRVKADPRLASIPVILLTAKSEDPDVIRGLDAGADDYVTKPFKRAILAARVRSAVRAKRSYDTIARINDRLRIEIDERKRMEFELARAHRLESVGQLAAGIAHEINTPNQYVRHNIRFIEGAFEDVEQLLRAVERFLEASEKGEPDPARLEDLKNAACKVDAPYLAHEVPKAIRESREGLEHVERIVRTVKEFASCGTGQKVPLDLHRAIEDALLVCRHAWKDVAELTTDFDPRLPLVPCVPGEFGELILNLVLNASQAIADAGREPPGGKGAMAIRTRLLEGWVEIRIEDNGTGIPEEIRARVFDPFFTTREVGQGTGQGLTIAHAIVVKGHGGTIHFETETGRGTAFIVRLPLPDDAASEEHDAFDPPYATLSQAPMQAESLFSPVVWGGETALPRARRAEATRATPQTTGPARPRGSRAPAPCSREGQSIPRTPGERA
jgi:signal transduction histidine kinase